MLELTGYRMVSPPLAAELGRYTATQIIVSTIVHHPGLSRRGWGLLAVAVLALLTAVYAFSGMAMAGSFSGVDARSTTHWQRVAMIYAALLLVAAAGFVAAVLAFRRVWQSDRARIVEEAV